MNILYKISGYDGNYVIRYYKTSKLDKKFSIPIPIKEYKWEDLNDDKIADLFEYGYIDEFFYRKLKYNSDLEENWFYAVDKNDSVYVSIVKRKGDNLVGHYPNFIDKNRATIIWSIYALIYFPIVIYLILKVF